MRKVFWDNPYQTTLTTKVAQVKGARVLFEETIIFSFCGGQESDKAFVNNMPVIDSHIIGNLIYYTLPEHGLTIGDVVTMEIDWTRRYSLMRLHFAAELILELVTRYLKVEKIGAHIAQSKARIDFVYNQNISHSFALIQEQYNDIIKKDLTIKTDFTDVANQRRFWEIAGLSKVACGGTHVKSTAEVGYVTLKRINVGSGKERIEIKLIENS